LPENFCPKAQNLGPKTAVFGKLGAKFEFCVPIIYSVGNLLLPATPTF